MRLPSVLETVSCPPDRGDEGYQGRVMGVGETEHRSHKGDPYHWVTVRHPRGSKHLWPSNRLIAAH